MLPVDRFLTKSHVVQEWYANPKRNREMSTRGKHVNGGNAKGGKTLLYSHFRRGKRLTLLCKSQS